MTASISLSRWTARAGLGLTALLLLGGCTGYPSWGGGSKRHIPARTASSLEQPAPAGPDQNYAVGERPLSTGSH